MFELEKAVAEWRERLAADAVYGAADLDELEGHLRERVAAMTARGSNAEEAFAAALRELGDARDLRREYAKNRRLGVWGRRLVWALGGYLSAVLVLSASMGLTLALRELVVPSYGPTPSFSQHSFAALNYAVQIACMAGAVGLVLSRRRARGRAVIAAVVRPSLALGAGLAAVVAILPFVSGYPHLLTLPLFGVHVAINVGEVWRGLESVPLWRSFAVLSACWLLGLAAVAAAWRTQRAAPGVLAKLWEASRV